jgi:hypothetical protein
VAAPAVATNPPMVNARAAAAKIANTRLILI